MNASLLRLSGIGILLLGMFGLCALSPSVADSSPPAAALQPPEAAAALYEYEVTLRQGVAGYYGGSDTYLSHWSVNANYGADPLISVRSDGDKTAVLRFDLAGVSIPANAEVINAQLDLWVGDRSNSNPMDVGVYEMLRPWAEMEATWNQASVGTPWQIPGANGVADRSSAASDTETVSETATWYQFNLTALVQK